MMQVCSIRSVSWAWRGSLLLAGLLLGSPSFLPAQDSSTSPLPLSSGFDGLPMTSGRSFERVPVYLPPELPPLGTLVPRRFGSEGPTLGSGGRGAYYPAEAEAAEFVGEFFYPPLALRVSEAGGYRDVPDAVERYRVQRDTLVRELRAELEQVRALPAEERERRLRACARVQAERLVRLEDEAEHQRARLSNSEQAWGATRMGRVRLDDTDGYSNRDLSLLVRDVAYFVDGLEVWQRHLLLELARDVELYGAPTTLTANPTWLSFNPEPARLLLPPELSLELAGKIAAYESLKADLKRGLYEALLDSDRSIFATLRVRKLRAYFEGQADAVRELDTRAEALRRELNGLPEMRRLAIPATSPLSPILAERLQAIVSETRQLRQSTAAEVNAIRRREPSLFVAFRVSSAGLEFSVWPRNGRRGETGNRTGPVESVKKELADIGRAYSRRLLEINERFQALRKDAAATLAPMEPEEVGLVLKNASLVALQRDRAEAQQLYFDATLEPGLSPAQRRLLLSEATVALDLDLPSGLRQATRK
ncbi:MAG: hypothetical protein JNN01_22340 [Opitutaceae bacterium]|nr:hypothetical protein [Opitutaceae bacterium]